MKLDNELLKEYLGTVDKSYIGYSLDSNTRKKAASGGFLSALLIYLLEKKIIDGVVVSKIVVEDGEINAKVFIAKNKEDVLEARSSIYFDVNLLTALEEMRSFDGKLAIVGLPWCQLEMLNSILIKDEKLRKKIYIRIGLFCGHNSNKKLIYSVLDKKGIDRKDIEEFKFRQGKWRGHMYIRLKNGKEITFPFQHFSVYQNLHFFALNKCASCSDQFGNTADISTGDVWLKAYKEKKVKHSAFFTRNEWSTKIVEGMISEGWLYADEVDQLEIFNSQRRGLIFHKSIKVRLLLSKIFRLHIHSDDIPKVPIRWNDFLASLIVLANMKISESEKLSDIMFKVPRKIIFLYLLLFKFLTNF